MSTWELFQASDICPPDFASLTPLEQSELYKRFQASRTPEPEAEAEPGSQETTEREAALDLWGDGATAEDAQSGGAAMVAMVNEASARHLHPHSSVKQAVERVG